MNRIQNPAMVTSWGFDSPSRYQCSCGFRYFSCFYSAPQFLICSAKIICIGVITKPYSRHSTQCGHSKFQHCHYGLNGRESIASPRMMKDNNGTVCNCQKAFQFLEVWHRTLMWLKWPTRTPNCCHRIPIVKRPLTTIGLQAIWSLGSKCAP